MKKIVSVFLCVLCAGLLVSCGKTTQSAEPTAVGGIADEVFTLPANLSSITAAETMDDADVTCVPLERDGKVVRHRVHALFERLRRHRSGRSCIRRL